MYFLLSGIFVFGADNPSENKSQTNRNSKKRVLPSLNKKGKSTAMSALLWLTDVFADCWKDGAPRIFDVIDFRVWVPLRISEAILFFTPNNAWIMSECFYKHRQTVMVSLLTLSWAVGIIRFGWHATLSLCCFTEYELLYYQRNKAV